MNGMGNNHLLALVFATLLVPGCAMGAQTRLPPPATVQIFPGAVLDPDRAVAVPNRALPDPQSHDRRTTLRPYLIAVALPAVLLLACGLHTPRRPTFRAGPPPGPGAWELAVDAVASHGDVDHAPTTGASLDRALDVFIVFAPSDAAFVRGDLLPALALPDLRVLLIDELELGAPIVSELERGVSSSRFTIAVLSPACFDDPYAMFGVRLASYASLTAVHILPLRLADVPLPPSLEARVMLDFRRPARRASETARLRALLARDCGHAARDGATGYATATLPAPRSPARALTDTRSPAACS